MSRFESPIQDHESQTNFYKESDPDKWFYAEARDGREELRLVDAWSAGKRGKILAINRLDLDSDGNPIGESND